jgi:hypothetical protein
MNVSEQYSGRVDKYNFLLKKQNYTINMLSALRLIAFLTGGLSSAYFYYINMYILSLGILALSMIIFIIFVSKHKKVKRKRDYTLALIEINSISYERIKGDWRKFEDSGADFMDVSHRYSGDLDLFGEGSLFQWINTSNTFEGRFKLKKALTETPSSVEEIFLRQGAIKELSGKIKWRQKFNAEGRISLKSNKFLNTGTLYNWIYKPSDFRISKAMQTASKILPAVTITLLLLSFFTPFVPRKYPYILLIIQMGILFLNNKKLNSILDTAHSYKNNIILYDKMLSLIHNTKFDSPWLIRLKYKLKGTNGASASEQINKLVKIVYLISDRKNMFYMIVNILTLWDINCAISLERWKKESGVFLEEWLDTIGEFEAISSLSIIHFDNPAWCFPEVKDEFPVLKAVDAGHPLIKSNRVNNEININKECAVLLITGSNMSGKSTYLRTAGVNLILAYAGAPVCAEAFSCSIMKVFTCMRISDNLEKNISSFYAEILRIKEIVKASEYDENVFFLLDEIFKGTNSIDRHLGAKILINKLISENAVGMVSTHDLELGELEQETKQKVVNFHFEEYYQNGELHFDYKLRSGISTTRNAMYLIKMAGIE